MSLCVSSDGRTRSPQQSIRPSSQQTVPTNIYSRSEIDVCIHVLRQDGGWYHLCLHVSVF